MSGFSLSEYSSDSDLPIPSTSSDNEKIEFFNRSSSPARCSHQARSDHRESRLPAGGSKGRPVTRYSQHKNQSLQRRSSGSEPGTSSSRRSSRNRSAGQDKSNEKSYLEMLERFNQLRERMCRCSSAGDQCRCTESRTILEEEKQRFVASPNKDKKLTSLSEPTHGSERVMTTKVHAPTSGYIKETVIEMSASCNAGTLTITRRILEKCDKDEDTESEGTSKEPGKKPIPAVAAPSESSELDSGFEAKNQGKKKNDEEAEKLQDKTDKGSEGKSTDDEQTSTRSSRSRTRHTSSKRSSKRSVSSSPSDSIEEKDAKMEKQNESGKIEPKSADIRSQSSDVTSKSIDQLRADTSKKGSDSEKGSTKLSSKEEEAPEEELAMAKGHSKSDNESIETQRSAKTASQRTISRDGMPEVSKEGILKSRENSVSQNSKLESERSTRFSPQVTASETERPPSELENLVMIQSSNAEALAARARSKSQTSGEVMSETQDQRSTRSSRQVTASETERPPTELENLVMIQSSNAEALAAKARSKSQTSGEVMSETQDQRSNRSSRQVTASETERPQSVLENLLMIQSSNAEALAARARRKSQTSGEVMSETQDRRSTKSLKAMWSKQESSKIQNSQEGTSQSSREVVLRSEKNEDESEIFDLPPLPHIQSRPSSKERNSKQPSKEPSYRSDEQPQQQRSPIEAVFGPEYLSTMHDTPPRDVREDLNQNICDEPHPKVQCCSICRYCAMKIARSMDVQQTRQNQRIAAQNRRQKSSSGSSPTPLRFGSPAPQQKKMPHHNAPADKPITCPCCLALSQPYIDDISPCSYNSSSTSAHARSHQRQDLADEARRSDRFSQSQKKKEFAKTVGRHQQRKKTLGSELNIPSEFNCELVGEVSDQCAEDAEKPCCCKKEQTNRTTSRPRADTSSEEYSRSRKLKVTKRYQKSNDAPTRIKAVPIKADVKGRRRSCSSMEHRNSLRRSVRRSSRDPSPNGADSSSCSSTKKTSRKKSPTTDKSNAAAKQSKSTQMVKSILVPLIYFGPQQDCSGSCNCGENQRISQQQHPIKINDCTSVLQGNMVPISIQYCEANVINGGNDDSEKKKPKGAKKVRRERSGEDTKTNSTKKRCKHKRRKSNIHRYLLSELPEIKICADPATAEICVCPTSQQDCNIRSCVCNSAGNTMDRQRNESETSSRFEEEYNLSSSKKQAPYNCKQCCMCQENQVETIAGTSRRPSKDDDCIATNSSCETSRIDVGDVSSRIDDSSFSKRRESSDTADKTSCELSSDGPPACRCIEDRPCRRKHQKSRKISSKYYADIVVEGIDRDCPIIMEREDENYLGRAPSSEWASSQIIGNSTCSTYVPISFKDDCRSDPCAGVEYKIRKAKNRCCGQSTKVITDSETCCFIIRSDADCEKEMDEGQCKCSGKRLSICPSSRLFNRTCTNCSTKAISFNNDEHCFRKFEELVQQFEEESQACKKTWNQYGMLSLNHSCSQIESRPAKLNGSCRCCSTQTSLLASNDDFCRIFDEALAGNCEQGAAGRKSKSCHCCSTQTSLPAVNFQQKAAGRKRLCCDAARTSGKRSISQCSPAKSIGSCRCCSTQTSLLASNDDSCRILKEALAARSMNSSCSESQNGPKISNCKCCCCCGTQTSFQTTENCATQNSSKRSSSNGVGASCKVSINHSRPGIIKKNSCCCATQTSLSISNDDCDRILVALATNCEQNPAGRKRTGCDDISSFGRQSENRCCCATQTSLSISNNDCDRKVEAFAGKRNRNPAGRKRSSCNGEGASCKVSINHSRPGIMKKNSCCCATQTSLSISNGDCDRILEVEISGNCEQKPARRKRKSCDDIAAFARQSENQCCCATQTPVEADLDCDMLEECLGMSGREARGQPCCCATQTSFSESSEQDQCPQVCQPIVIPIAVTITPNVCEYMYTGPCCSQSPAPAPCACNYDCCTSCEPWQASPCLPQCGDSCCQPQYCDTRCLPQCCDSRCVPQCCDSSCVPPCCTSYRCCEDSYCCPPRQCCTKPFVQTALLQCCTYQPCVPQFCTPECSPTVNEIKCKSKSGKNRASTEKSRKKSKKAC